MSFGDVAYSLPAPATQGPGPVGFVALYFEGDKPGEFTQRIYAADPWPRRIAITRPLIREALSLPGPMTVMVDAGQPTRVRFDVANGFAVYRQVGPEDAGDWYGELVESRFEAPPPEVAAPAA